MEFFAHHSLAHIASSQVLIVVTLLISLIVIVRSVLHER